MENDTEVIKDQMANTRESLTEKLETLENHVVSTVQDTTQAVTNTVESVTGAVQDTVSAVKDTVSDTVETVKHTVSDTVDSVKEALDIRQQVERHPWAMLAGAVAVGFIAGKLIPPPRSRDFVPPGHWPQVPHRPTEAFASAPAASGPSAGRADEGWLDSVSERFKPALEKVKELALNASAGLIGELVVSAVGPSIRTEVSQVVDEIATALGGKAVHAADHLPPEPTGSRPEAPHNRMRSMKGNGRRG